MTTRKEFGKALKGLGFKSMPNNYGGILFYKDDTKHNYRLEYLLYDDVFYVSWIEEYDAINDDGNASTCEMKYDDIIVNKKEIASKNEDFIEPNFIDRFINEG